MLSRRYIFLLVTLLLFSCSKTAPEDPSPDPEPPVKEEDKYGLSYLFSTDTCIPEIHISVPLEEWNHLLDIYDANNYTNQYVHCDVIFDKDGDKTIINNAGLRLRGNTSRRRPESDYGKKHQASGTNWHHCHFGLNFRKYEKDDDHTIHGARKLNLKWFKDDPTYTRELYCYDLFRRFGVWTAVNDIYCRLYLKVEGDETESYFGVYEMMESIDTRYVKARSKRFGGAGGNLWKCRYPAPLNSVYADFGLDDGSDSRHVYELKSDENDFNAATEQLKDFILKLTGKSDESFYTWIKQVCDVDLLLKTYAVNVAVGMWDDYWNNMNNYYIYFNSTDKYDYKFFFIPYDYDNTLGTSSMMDSGRQDPFNWGNNANLLIYRILKFPEFREIYKNYLLALVAEEGPFCYASSISRLTKWQNSIRNYVQNDTYEDCEIKDRPASWGNHSEYRLFDTNENTNFFRVKEASIKQYCR